ncbi:WAT1-related protein [Tripterygium wilfordii]|uniref:WAT1-related protein n=1 Tax=Tripterygium wilfordii TaxID=458696 RepID=A0A7J7C7B9_TRIWF|nr:WAT1-related protein At5g47470-like isoform X1 [Tripterygium wilfordii]KAF5729845.1 WAT1-related protein [Tripterygium wilfordii]
MDWNARREKLEDVLITGGLILNQFVYAGNSVLMSYLMSLGLKPFTIVIFSTFATFLILSPLAVCFERSKWPNQLTSKLVIQLVLIAFGGVTLFQTLFLEGINLTSPAMATAMPNLAPGLIFIIAWTFRFEKVKLSCTYSKVKIAGTLLCVVGAITMSLMHSTTSIKQARMTSPDHHHHLDPLFDRQKIIGCLYLMAAVIVLSSNVVLQAAVLGDFPAPVSISAITSFIGVLITATVQMFQDRSMEINWPLTSIGPLIGYSLLGGMVSGASVSFSGWAMKKRGPVLVSMFSPIATVISVILSAITLGETIKIGSLAGMFLMFTGLYFVLWAKGREDHANGDGLESEFDAQKPLLS